MTESCYTAIIRTTCLHDVDVHKALELYEEMKSVNINPKNRTMLPLLAKFSELGDVKVCFYGDVLTIRPTLICVNLRLL